MDQNSNVRRSSGKKSNRFQLVTLLIAGLALLLGYQNCANSTNFDGSNASSSKGSLVTTIDPVNGDSGSQDPNVALNPPPSPDDDDSDDEIDYDHDGKRVIFNCITGARRGWDQKDFTNAPDLRLENKTGLIFNYRRPVNNVFVHNVVGSIGIRNANLTTEYTNVKGMVSALRSVEVSKASSIEAAVSSTATMKLDELSNVKAGFICASGAEIGKISNLSGLFMKIRGRPTEPPTLTPGTRPSSAVPTRKGYANEVSNLKGAFISIAHLNSAKISNVEGELIIRDGTIDELSNIKGGLTLINSRVKMLKDVDGVLRIKNSTIDSQSNVSGRTIQLK